MDNNIIKQTLLASFEALKDSWSTKKEALIKCIVYTEKYDGDMAMNMWLYLLQKNEKNIHNDEDFVYNVLSSFCEEYDNYTETIFSYVVPHLIKNSKLIELIFGQTKNSGTKYNLLFISDCIAGFILSDEPDIVYHIMTLLSNNKYLTDVTIGRILLQASNEVTNRIKNGEKDKKVSVATKEALLSSLDLIKDKKERAECSIAIISLD